MLFQWSEAIGQAPGLAPEPRGPPQALCSSCLLCLEVPPLDCSWHSAHSSEVSSSKGGFPQPLGLLVFGTLLHPPPLPHITCPVSLLRSPCRYLIYPDYLVAYVSSVSRCVRAGPLLVSISPGPRCQERCWPIGDAQ